MKQLLNGVSLYLNEGDRIGIIGINGTGKSTLLRILAGVSEPDSGNISTKPNIQISYLPQNPDINPEMTVLEQVMSDATKVLTKSDVMEGVADMISLIQVEAVFTDGSRLVSIHKPIK